MPLDLPRSSLDEDLAPIARAGVRAAHHRRRLPDGLADALGALLTPAPWIGAAEGTPAAAVHAMAADLPVRLPPALRQDIALLAHAFARLIARDTLRIRLEALVGHGCHRWHADAVGLRLLCTYAGPGTQWLELEGGARAARALPRGALPPGLRQAGPADVLVLKGEGFPGQAGQGAIHRSPPNPDSAPPRLILCLDEPGRIPVA